MSRFRSAAWCWPPRSISRASDELSRWTTIAVSPMNMATTLVSMCPASVGSAIELISNVVFSYERKNATRITAATKIMRRIIRDTLAST